MNQPMTEESFLDWVGHPITQRFFKKLAYEREEMKEGLVNDNFEHPDTVKGMCKCISQILNITYEDMYEPKRD